MPLRHGHVDNQGCQVLITVRPLPTVRQGRSGHTNANDGTVPRASAATRRVHGATPSARNARQGDMCVLPVQLHLLPFSPLLGQVLFPCGPITGTDARLCRPPASNRWHLDQCRLVVRFPPAKLHARCHRNPEQALVSVEKSRPSHLAAIFQHQEAKVEFSADIPCDACLAEASNAQSPRSQTPRSRASSRATRALQTVRDPSLRNDTCDKVRPW